MRRMLVALAVAVTVVPFAGSRAVAGPVVLFDEGHGQRFLAAQSGELDLSGLADAFREAGMEVRTHSGPLDAGALKGVSALVISGAFAPIVPAETEAIRAFVGAGGRLALMLHIGQPYQGLLAQFGIQHSLGPVREAEGVIGGRDLDFGVTRFERHALTEGLQSLSVFGCWTLRSTKPGATPIALTGAKAWFDSDGNGKYSPGEPVGVQAVVMAGTLGSGEYVVFGDDAIFQNRFLQAYNRELGRRLARWLAASPAAAPRPSEQPRPKSIGL